MYSFFRLLGIAGLSMSLLAACSNDESSIEKAYESAKTETKEATGEIKAATSDAVEAAKDAAEVAREHIKETTEATEKAVSGN